jgi:predicted DNA-binding protein
MNKIETKQKTQKQKVISFRYFPDEEQSLKYKARNMKISKSKYIKLAIESYMNATLPSL